MLSIINKILWGITTVLLIVSGIYFSKKLNFLQFNVRRMSKGLQGKKDEKISPFKTLMLTLAARIGVGSLAGIALAIYTGGPGTIFWLWVSTVIVSSNAYAESFLAVLFHKTKDNKYNGGPSYYIDQGLNKKGLARVYAVLVFVTYIFGFLTIQSNTIAKSFENFNNSNPLIVGIIVAILTWLTIFKGSESIINISSKIMPFIGVLFITVSGYILVINIKMLPNIFYLIIREAFNIKSISAIYLFCLNQ